ncbi:MAG TPA: S8 family peptidase [Herpetosiphonaceae bacterium]
MKRFAALLVAGLIVVGSTLAHGSASAATTADKAEPRRYIVTLKADANPRSVAAIAGVEPKYVYDAALNGFAADLNQGQLNALRRHTSVVAIEPDGAILSDSVIASDEAAQAPVSAGAGINAASNVTAYVVNTGIYMAHSEFGGRAALGYDAFGGTGVDCNGVGTHMAGVIGGATYGIAKDVKLRSVRVLDCNGSGTTAGVIAGINWIANNGVKPAVTSVGFGGAANSSVDTAVANLVTRGITTVVPAGSSNADACNYSPARVASAITVGTANGTTKAPYSNYGPCVDVYAPGTRTAAWIGSTSATNTISGTTVSAAYVSGCIALYLGGNPTATPTQVYNWVIANAPISGTIRIFTCPF